MIVGVLSGSEGMLYIVTFLSSAATIRISPSPRTRLQNLMSCIRDACVTVCSSFMSCLRSSSAVQVIVSVCVLLNRYPTLKVFGQRIGCPMLTTVPTPLLHEHLIVSRAVIPQRIASHNTFTHLCIFLYWRSPSLASSPTFSASCPSPH